MTREEFMPRIPGKTLKRDSNVMKKLMWSAIWTYPALNAEWRTSTIWNNTEGSSSGPAIYNE